MIISPRRRNWNVLFTIDGAFWFKLNSCRGYQVKKSVAHAVLTNIKMPFSIKAEKEAFQIRNTRTIREEIICCSFFFALSSQTEIKINLFPGCYPYSILTPTPTYFKQVIIIIGVGSLIEAYSIEFAALIPCVGLFFLEEHSSHLILVQFNSHHCLLACFSRTWCIAIAWVRSSLILSCLVVVTSLTMYHSRSVFIVF